jgi:hypothetical protein
MCVIFIFEFKEKNNKEKRRDTFCHYSELIIYFDDQMIYIEKEKK